MLLGHAAVRGARHHAHAAEIQAALCVISNDRPRLRRQVLTGGLFHVAMMLSRRPRACAEERPRPRLLRRLCAAQCCGWTIRAVEEVEEEEEALSAEGAMALPAWRGSACRFSDAHTDFNAVR